MLTETTVIRNQLSFCSSISENGWPLISSPKGKEVKTRGSSPEKSTLPQFKDFRKQVLTQFSHLFETFHDGGSKLVVLG